MDVTNHIVRGDQDLQLAMIQGRKVRAWCGIEYVPTVQVGTSGRADLPGAPLCDRCEEVVTTWREWIRLKDEKNRLIREMHALEKLQRTLQKEFREARETVDA